MNREIYGWLVDEAGRCGHYHLEVDIIAHQCQACKQFYGCIYCHDEQADHQFLPAKTKQAETVLCGACKKAYSYQEYEGRLTCSQCGSGFNPKCENHKHYYVRNA